ncbi:transglycosylase SLT domain-containing protein [Rhodovarius sp.]|uniref:transglycosylase SLT domain-containing protein n=1 Tax=Rhodovarius sp. TaxID=2972673 RepID=UPI0034A5A990
MEVSLPQARTRPRATLGGVALAAALSWGCSASAQQATDTIAHAARAPQRMAQPMAVMGAADAARMRRAFEAQARGDLLAAGRESEQLDDRRLMGHLLADRYLRATADTPIHALQAWLADHSDHPDAISLHTHLASRLPRGAALPPPPAQPDMPAHALEVPPEERPAGPALARNSTLDRQVRDRVAEGQPAQALLAIARADISPAYAGQLKAEIAQALFRMGQDEDALRIAGEALRVSAHNPNAAFQAGLAAWALESYELALGFFERAARSPMAAPALRSAAAFWTARAAVRARRPQAYVGWMLQAAQEPRTFYGMLARRTLGLPNGFAWENPAADASALAETAGGWRAMALLQIGQRQRAEAELRLLYRRGRGNPLLTQAILTFAGQAGMNALVTQVAAASQSEDGRPRDFARFPLPTLLPSGGYRVDPALLYALALQESRFDPMALSRAGARGILQIMPATASYIANDPSLSGANAERLHEPGFGLELGQRYLHYLARHDTVGGDLIRLLAAYNAGPGNLSRWLPSAQHRQDPLLFIESIPVTETRAYVQRVLGFSWIYASRLGLPAASLDALASGSFPRFAQPGDVTAMLRVGRQPRLN